MLGDEYNGFARAIEAAEAEVDRYRRLLDEAVTRRRRAMALQHTDTTGGAA